MTQKAIALESQDEQRLLFGPRDRNLRLVRERYRVRLTARRGQLLVDGEDDAAEEAHDALLRMLDRVRRFQALDTSDVETMLTPQTPNEPRPAMPETPGNGRQRPARPARPRNGGESPHEADSGVPAHLIDESARVGEADVAMGGSGVSGRLFKHGAKPLTKGQSEYMDAVLEHDLVFCTGPAGTGKTFLATAMAVDALNRGIVRRLVLVRPAVEAGEKLGFLPGDYQAKINPYLRPIFDALGSLLDFNALKRYIERDVIEVAPLAYMRGRTLDNAFIILDEAQNTTPAQMLMFLTRIGRRSKAVVTGDDTQADLPPDQKSGLVDALHILRHTNGIAFVRLHDTDIVRHALVQRIVLAYEKAEERADYPLFNRRTDTPSRKTRFGTTESDEYDQDEAVYGEKQLHEPHVPDALTPDVPPAPGPTVPESGER